MLLSMNLLKYANRNIPQTQEEKDKIIQDATAAYEKFLDALRFDWRSDPHSTDTPARVARSFVNDLIKGCYSHPPVVTAFENIDRYDGIICQNNIRLVSMCSHHHLSFSGNAHVAYIPAEHGKVIGLSKLNRIVDWFGRRPQVQENLTAQIHDYVDEVCELNRGVAVLIEANHTCCSNRGIGHESTMRTAKMSGAFQDPSDNAKDEFFKFIEYSK